ncbi:hypothetical protein WM40_13530 [Robbsia andropogonis]|uniref:Biopolymer transporter ExbD n=1 Tax=Robbsia andropogonis TaxID=28092 RepID=A0A0F5JZE8_9BURK|nr:biopolymer transporter ExbD [Robbsia andropogonis]KKB63040.1 hypothetical protein WM40_13530 [Robbsia andropogonis]
MGFGGFDPHGNGQDGGTEQSSASGRYGPGPLAIINMTPLIDVMLVLLVIFILASSLAPRQIGLQLPKTALAPRSPGPAEPTPPTITISIDVNGARQWNGAAVDAAGLDARLRAAAARDPQPQIALQADQRTPYARIAEVMAAAQRVGLTRFGFVVDTPTGGAAAGPGSTLDIHSGPGSASELPLQPNH